jgi:hypothetical protein
LVHVVAKSAEISHPVSLETNSFEASADIATVFTYPVGKLPRTHIAPELVDTNNEGKSEREIAATLAPSAEQAIDCQLVLGTLTTAQVRPAFVEP